MNSAKNNLRLNCLRESYSSDPSEYENNLCEDSDSDNLISDSSLNGSQYFFEKRYAYDNKVDYDIYKKVPNVRSNPYKYFDSHCHLHKLFQKENFFGSFDTFRSQNEILFPAAFDGCLNVFYDPLNFGDKSCEDLLNQDLVYGAFGCHPCHSHNYNQDAEDILLRRLQHRKVVALGEVGLDYYRECPDRETQKAVFRCQLKIAVDRQLPIAIHSRDAEDDTLQIVKECVPHGHLIHRHCFVGSWKQLLDWTMYFPNFYVGFTNLLTSPKVPNLHEVAKLIPLERILLETDAPFFLPHDVKMTAGYNFSNPGMAIFVASKIAACRSNITFENVLQAARKNTTKIYNI